MNNIEFTGRTIDHYSIVALIRGGGQGTVYHGRDEILCRDVAIKVVNWDERGKEASHQSLLAEARALSRLSHPHVAGVYDFVTDDDRDFLIMEFVAGATLQEVLAGGPLPPTEVVRLGTQLARGIAAIHAAKIAHRDIKPSNLKITSAGLLKIVDFGIAQQLRSVTLPEAPTTTFTVAGTLPYMAPEVLAERSADERSDIFSAGAVLYEMATACRAFPQRTLPTLVAAIEACQLIAPSRVNPAVSPALERVVLRALKKSPSGRYQNAAELAEALDNVLPIDVAPARKFKWQTTGWRHISMTTQKLLAALP